MEDLIDPTTAGQYPVILSDSLLNGSRDEIFTGIRYNHKPSLSSTDAPEHARLKPSTPGHTSSYDLSYLDNGGTYAYAGTRNSANSQYVLYFDPKQQAFILDRVESTFDMNITRVPGNSDPATLARKYPHLETNAKTEQPKKKPAPKPRAKSPLMAAKTKPEKKAAPKNHSLALPEPSKPAPRKAKDEEEDEDEDDDGGLLIEYPDDAKPSRRDFSPAFPSVRRFDDFMDQRESEADDADGESGEEYEDLRLPSPVGQREREVQREESAEPMQVEEADGHNDDEDDLEKDLEMAFEAALDNGGQGSGDESEISEED